VWAILSLTLLLYPYLFASSVPYIDDWELVPVFTGNQPVDLTWLGARHNEHRIPLPKLILVALAKVGGDHRAGMYFSAAALSALAAVLIVAAKRLRGWTSAPDAFLPLALLHWGHSEVLYFGIAVNVTLVTVLLCLILVCVVTIHDRPFWRGALLIGGMLVLLPLNGAMALAIVPPLALWLTYAGVQRCRSGEPHGLRDAALALTAAVVAFGMCSLYFVGREVTVYETSRSVETTLLTASQFAALGAGPVGEVTWPYSAGILIALSGLSAWGLVSVLRSRPPERIRALGLLAIFAAVGALAFAVGWGRPVGSFRVHLSATRYVTMAVPLLCWAYFTSCLYLNRAVPACLFVVMLLLFPVNTYYGWQEGLEHRKRLAPVESDIASGLSPAEVAKKWTSAIYSKDIPPELVAERLEMLRAKGEGPYKTRRGAHE
jgi:hypothetical protein